jgi:hypothetical protein
MNPSEAAGSAYPTGVASMIFGETGMRGDLEELLGIAKHAARPAATLHLRARHGDLEVRTKHSPIDLVTELDRESERPLVSAIRTPRPNHAFLARKGPTSPEVLGSAGSSILRMGPQTSSMGIPRMLSRSGSRSTANE